MNRCEKITLFGKDAEIWEKCGLSAEEEHALVLALWDWFRGRPTEGELSKAAKLVFYPLIARWEAQEEQHANKLKAARARHGGVKHAAPAAENPAPAAQNPAPAETPSETPSDASAETPVQSAAEKRARFVKPSEAAVEAFCVQEGLTNVNAAQFVAYYSANGWKVGRMPMKDWQAAARNWNIRAQQQQDDKRSKNELIGLELRNQSMREEDYVL